MKKREIVLSCLYKHSKLRFCYKKNYKKGIMEEVEGEATLLSGQRFFDYTVQQNHTKLANKATAAYAAQSKKSIYFSTWRMMTC